jgi:transposase
MTEAIDPVQEIAELRALLTEREAELAMARAELTGAKLRIEQYQAQLAKLRRMQFGRSSEKLDTQIVQLELLLEDLEEGEAARTAPAGEREADQPRRERRQPVRRPLPEHLPREKIVHHPGSVCPGCGGTRFSKLGEDVTEVLEKIPARLKVIRHIRPKLSCRSCEKILQVSAPDLPIEKGRPGPGLVANVVVGKYLDGLPLYRQSAILAREGVEIERATLADWVGHVAWWVAPLAELTVPRSWRRRLSTPTIRLSRCWRRATARRGPDDCGPMCSTSGRGKVVEPRPLIIASARTARGSGRAITWPASAG